MNAAFQATKAGIIALGFLTGFTFLSLTLIVLNTTDFIPIALLGFSILFFSVCLVVLLMAARKFGNNEIEIASMLVKRANLLFLAALLLIYFVIALWLLQIELITSAVFAVAVVLLLYLIIRFGKKKFKYW